MLSGLRRAGQSVVGKIILTVTFGILIVSFAIWGIGDIFRATPQNVVAKVGSTEITVTQFRNAYNNEMKQLNARAGGRVTPDMARRIGLDRRVLGRLISEAVLNERAHALGLNVSEQSAAKALLDAPNFKDAGGQFNRRMFESALVESGLSEMGFFQDQRLAMARSHLGEAMAGGLPVPLAAREAQNRFANERRQATYFILPASASGTVPAPTQEQLQSFYEERKTSFRAPEYRTISLMVLDAAALAKPEAVSDADARERYERAKGSYGTPERRTLQQIVFPSTDEAEAAFARIKAGTSLEAIAQERGISPQDLTLGTFTKAEMLDPAVADAGFALADGAVSGPVAGRFGTVLVRAAKIEPEAIKPFDTVAAEIRRTIAQERARETIDGAHDEIEDLRASAKPLVDVGKEKGLAVVTLPAVDESGLDKAGKPVAGIPESAALLRAAFASDVGVDNEPLRTASGGYVWYDVTNIEPARDRPLDEVRAAAEAQWRDNEIAQRLTDKARQLVERIDKGEAIDALAAESGASVETASDLVRRQAKGNLSVEAVTRIFATPVGKAGSAPNGADARAVFKVTAATVPALVTTTQQAQRAEDALRDQFADMLLSEYIDKGQAALPVVVNEQALRTVVGGDG